LAAAAIGVALVGWILLAPTARARAAEPPLSVSIRGNHFVNGSGQTIRLLGVDVPSTEYACEEGWGYASLTTSPRADAATAASIASWGADAVRVPLNEDCWLGINGEPAFGTQAGYQQAIEEWVEALNAHGLYAIVDLHWSAPGTEVADGQRPMPDDNSVPFWKSVAATFESNPAVVFDAFNEPYSPAAESGGSTEAVSWSCWDNGGCSVPDAASGQTPDDADSYTAVGMQALVNAIRGTGANQPILLGGLSFANDLTGWLANEPTDPDHQLAASFHDYDGDACDTESCWQSEVAPVAAQVPVVTGEFDEGYDCQGPPAGVGSPTDLDNTFMNWADANGVSYLAWGWWELSPDPAATSCASLAGGGINSYALIGDDGNVLGPDGTDLRTHLLALATQGSPPTTTSTSTTSTSTTSTSTTSTTSTPTTSTPAPTASTSTSTPPTTSGPGTSSATAAPAPGGASGYFLVGADGGVFGFGDATFAGSLPGLSPPVRVDDIVGIVPTPDDRGYFLVGRDGGVFSFGDAPFLGSLPSLGIDVDDVVGIAATADGTGYWVVEADGSVHAFGTAASFGNASAAGSPLAGIAATPDGGGYWIVARNGAVQAFGDAANYGSLPALGITPAEPVVALVPTPDGGGYWLVASDGGIFAFGDAPASGSLPGLGVTVSDVVGAVPTR
jgi:endoglucanase